ncbi:D-alanyl-D-alanine carboxypeptidase [Echinicola sp. CAU 1574]|uniref:D-alanyl-D-alanine carboxypeptidase n=1 Tax=Echinicola arenosa TaxID=2774144 RepID=A0ABR9AG24_9BACT|nr:D-alanyl-D-alanine carboxypeptidase [Echinicola arenosa]MBD8487687.1 D-alanyl-D-alanine carboxypeptidase [Echinicola arenosa]
MLKRIITLFLLQLSISLSLLGQSHSKFQKDLEQLLGAQSFFGHHQTGFALYDLDEQKMKFEHNSHLNFIPASTTKLFTFYAGLMVLGDSTKKLRYIPKGKDVLIWGTGDPSWHYKPLPQQDLNAFFSAFDKVYFSDDNWKENPFGYGWQWDDYYYSYSAERSPLPIYGNLVTVNSKNQSPKIIPKLFSKNLLVTSKEIKDIERDFHSNNFYYNPQIYRKQESKVPFITSPETFALLASEALGKEVILSKEKLPEEHFILKGIPLDSLYREMLHESDNFLAEQLLLMVSDELFMEMNDAETIEHLVENFLFDLPDQPQWVDGSGLSRHNLFTPSDMVSIAEKIYRIVPDTTLFRLLPQGGRTGTLKNAYRAPTPYVFAKTGTMSNNHCLVGYLKTHKNKLYAFAFMNNNYPYKAKEVISEMEKVLLYIRDNF